MRGLRQRTLRAIGWERWAAALKTVALEDWLRGALGREGYDLLGLIGFTLMGLALYRVARRRLPEV